MMHNGNDDGAGTAGSILAGDIGGTTTTLALYTSDSRAVCLSAREEYPSRSFGALDDIVRRFLDRYALSPVACAAFGIAGPVCDGRVRPTNLEWPEIEAEALSSMLGGVRTVLLNDLEAAAYGALFLKGDEVAVLQEGTEPFGRGHVAAVAAGTGLGEAFLHWDGVRHRPMASEGGHGDFAPRDDVEFELMRFLADELGGRVSVERVLSGTGLYDLYRFFRSRSGRREPAALAERLRSADRNAVVGAAGLAQLGFSNAGPTEPDPVCAQAVGRFVSIYGAEAGNAVLRGFARGGVVILGGIAPKLLAALRDGAFLRSFRDKGRFSDWLGTVEVRVALAEDTPLLGCAHYARTRPDGGSNETGGGA